MKWKVTAQFLLFIILTIFLSLFAFLALNILLLYSNFGKSDSLIPYQSPSNYTLDFEKNIDFKNKEISIPADKLTELEQGDIWIQVLDENGTEIYSQFKPANVPDHYTPASLIHYHKYTGALENSTIFVGMLERGNRNLSYIMGFPEEVIGKAYIYYRTEIAFTRCIHYIFRYRHYCDNHCSSIWIYVQSSLGEAACENH